MFSYVFGILATLYNPGLAYCHMQADYVGADSYVYYPETGQCVIDTEGELQLYQTDDPDPDWVVDCDGEEDCEVES